MTTQSNTTSRAIELLDAYTPSILESLARIKRVISRLEDTRDAAG